MINNTVIRAREVERALSNACDDLSTIIDDSGVLINVQHSIDEARYYLKAWLIDNERTPRAPAPGKGER